MYTVIKYLKYNFPQRHKENEEKPTFIKWQKTRIHSPTDKYIFRQYRLYKNHIQMNIQPESFFCGNFYALNYGGEYLERKKI